MNLRRLLHNMFSLSTKEDDCDRKHLAEDSFSRKFINVFWKNFADESVGKFLVERSLVASKNDERL